MRIHVVLLCASIAITGCKKKGTGGGGGGGGGGWLVGDNGLMANITSQGKLGPGYDLGATEELHAIACRDEGEAYVVGAHGTVLYTDDAGASWSALVAPTTADLRGLATQDDGPVFVAGDGTFLVTSDTGASWTELSDGATHFRSIAAAELGDTVLALSDDGGLWSYDGHALVRRTTLAGARAVAVSTDGAFAITAGQGLARSADGGTTWTPLAVDPAVMFDDVRIAADGSAIAVGAHGAIARIDAAGSVTVEHAGDVDLHALHMADPLTTEGLGYAAGDGGQVLITQDGGATWTPGPNLGRTVFGIDEIGFGHR